MKFSFDHASGTFAVDLVPGDSGKSYRLMLGEQTFAVEVLQAKDGKLELLLDGKRMTAYVTSDNTKCWVTINGETVVLAKSSGARRGGRMGPHAAGELTAPMPGQVRAVNVSEGQAVTKGQTLLVLEAMKMEIRIHAPQAGMVRKLFVKQGQSVERQQILIEIEEN